jgi:hypothetical protein
MGPCFRRDDSGAIQQALFYFDPLYFNPRTVITTASAPAFRSTAIA